MRGGLDRSHAGPQSRKLFPHPISLLSVSASEGRLVARPYGLPSVPLCMLGHDEPLPGKFEKLLLDEAVLGLVSPRLALVCVRTVFFCTRHRTHPVRCATNSARGESFQRARNIS
jgi:hypothetical protein